MINSRDTKELLPVVQTKVDMFVKKCHEAGIDILITSTYRDAESQDALYAQGRTTPGKIVTNAKSGQSWHNHRCAIDVVPLVNGKPDWDGSHPVWAQIGKIGKECGLEWAGDWKTFREIAHFQYTGGITLAQLQAGRKIA